MPVSYTALCELFCHNCRHKFFRTWGYLIQHGKVCPQCRHAESCDNFVLDNKNRLKKPVIEMKAVDYV